MKKEVKSPITAVLFGAGNRGRTIYGNYALKHPDKLKFIAVAEPIDKRRREFAELHNIPEKNCFTSWEEIIAKDKMADTAFVCTQDQLHSEPTLQALERGYDILLEKPMAHTLENCIKIVKKAEETKRMLGVGHVLRYTSFFSKIHSIIKNGTIGDLVNITHRENVSWYHIAHSFVRGNWRNVKSSSPIILAKCCHDLDLLYWIVDSLPKKISSIGNLLHFNPENAPEGAPKYCVEGCPAQEICLYYAPRIYIDGEQFWQITHKSENKLYKFVMNLRKYHTDFFTGVSKIFPPLKRVRYWRDWPIDMLYENQPKDFSDEAKFELLKTSPYGRCVYQCDNDVVDHQMVHIEFENGVIANLTMHGFSDNEGRSLRIDGTKATLIGEFFTSGEKITLFDHYSGKEEIIYKQKLKLSMIVHGGGDARLINAFLDSVNTRKKQPLTNARESLESHLMAFAAEESRLNKVIVEMANYRKRMDA